MKILTVSICCQDFQAQNENDYKIMLLCHTGTKLMSGSDRLSYNKQDTPGYQFTKYVSHSPAEHITGLIMPQAMPFDLNGQHQGNALD